MHCSTFFLKIIYTNDAQFQRLHRRLQACFTGIIFTTNNANDRVIFILRRYSGIKHYSLPRISNAKFPRREITRKCRDRADTLHEIGSPRRAYHASSLAAARHLFFAGYQKQPRHRAADDRRSQSNADRVLAIVRIHLPLPLPPPRPPSPFRSLSSFLSRLLFLYFSHLRRPSLATLLTLSRSCVSYVRTNSISRDSLRSRSAVNYFSNSRSRPALLRLAPSPLRSSRSLRSLIPRTLAGSLSSSSL